MSAIVLLCMLAGVASQLLVPKLIYGFFDELINDSSELPALWLLMIVMAIKSLSLAFSSAWSARLEIEVRYGLCYCIQVRGLALPAGRKLTLIKEDAERVANAFVEVLSLVASVVLFVSAAIYLLIDNFYLSLALSVMLIILFVYFKICSKSIAFKYEAELEQDELYKHELGGVTSDVQRCGLVDECTVVAMSQKLSGSVRAKFEFERWRFFVAFLPEIALAVGVVVTLLGFAFSTPHGFDYRMIVYFGYLGIISMSSIHIVEIMLSLIGVRQSICRIRSAGCH